MAFADVAQPRTYDERLTLARRTCEELELDTTMLIDELDDRSRAFFGDLPSPAIVIGPDGTALVKLPWAEPDALGPRLAKALAEAGSASLADDAEPRARVGAALHAARVPQGADRTALSKLTEDLEDAELRALIALELAEDAESITQAAEAVRAAWPDDSDRRAAALARLAVDHASAPAVTPLLDEIAELAGEAAPTQRAWARSRSERR